MTIKNALKRVGGTDGSSIAFQNGMKQAFKKEQGAASEKEDSNMIQKTKHACIVEAHEST